MIPRRMVGESWDDYWDKRAKELANTDWTLSSRELIRQLGVAEGTARRYRLRFGPKGGRRPPLPSVYDKFDWANTTAEEAAYQLGITAAWASRQAKRRGFKFLDTRHRPKQRIRERFAGVDWLLADREIAHQKGVSVVTVQRARKMFHKRQFPLPVLDVWVDHWSITPT